MQRDTNRANREAPKNLHQRPKKSFKEKAKNILQKIPYNIHETEATETAIKLSSNGRCELYLINELIKNMNFTGPGLSANC